MKQIKGKGNRARLGILVSTVLLAGGSMAAIALPSAPANASQVDNNMLCDPGTHWCYQTNPPYNPNFPHMCHWDSQLTNLHSGMWYTGCQYWD